MIQEFLESNEFNELLEISFNGSGDGVDDGPSIFFKNLNNYKEDAKKYEVLGNVIIDYLVRNVTIKNGRQVNPVTPFPTGDESLIRTKEQNDLYKQLVDKMSLQLGYTYYKFREKL